MDYAGKSRERSASADADSTAAGVREADKSPCIVVENAGVDEREGLLVVKDATPLLLSPVGPFVTVSRTVMSDLNFQTRGKWRRR